MDFLKFKGTDCKVQKIVVHQIACVSGLVHQLAINLKLYGNN